MTERRPTMLEEPVRKQRRPTMLEEPVRKQRRPTMLGALVRKELRQLVPLVSALAALLLLTAGYDFVLEPVDQSQWFEGSWIVNPGASGVTQWMLLGLGLITAYNLLPGEFDRRTIELLYSLPVRRRVVFLVKFGVGFGVLAAFLVLSSMLGWLEQATNPDSFARRQFSWGWALIELGLDVLAAAIFVAYGMLVSFFRRLGWVLVVVTWLLLQLGKQLHPSLAVFDVRALFTVEHHGTRPLVPWGVWQLHAALGLLALAVAERLWSWRHETSAALGQRLRLRAGMRRVAIVGGSIAAALATAAVVHFTLIDPEADQPDEPERTQRLSTQHFTFTYRAADEPQARFIAGEADQAHERVRRWLDAPAIDPIAADLTEESDEHLGIAGWNTLAMDIRPAKPPALQRHVLYHEVTHVIGSALLGPAPRAGDLAAAVAEGLAEYLSYELLASDPVSRARRTEARQLAALAKARYSLRFEDLLDRETFLARHDEYLLYAVGEVWVAALVDACGQPAPGRLLAALGRDDVPQRLADGALLRHTLQGLGCDIERVATRFEDRLQRLMPETKGLPIASGTLVQAGAETLVFQVTVAAATPGPWEVTIRVRDDANSPHDQIVGRTEAVAAGTPARIVVIRPPSRGQRLEYQIGARAGPDAPPFFTRWTAATLPEGQ